MENRYNLIDESWILVTGHNRVSLRQIFSNPDYSSLSGNPVQKIAVLKLLLAIAQAAATPPDEKEWKELGAKGLAEHCLAYLEKWHSKFYLYGDSPFLQMPAIQDKGKKKVQPFSAVLPEVSTGNTTVLTQIQKQRDGDMDDGDKALLLLVLMGFALSGKKTDNSVVLTPGYVGKQNAKGNPASGKPGPSIGYMGLLHSFLTGVNIQKTVWLNILSGRQIEAMNMYFEGVGQAPWELMPQGENCDRAKQYKCSLMGRLIPLCRFCLLAKDGLHYSEGIAHDGYKEGIADPSVAIDYTGKQPKALWVNPDKRPWRELTALLGFFEQSDSQGFQNWQVRNGVERVKDAVDIFSVWSGGLRVSSNAGEQYVSGGDDYVESQVWIHSDILGEFWFSQLKKEMHDLDELAKNLYGRVRAFFKEQKADGSKIALYATQLFWQICEYKFQKLVDNCERSDESVAIRHQLRQEFAKNVQQAYDKFCPCETARQLDAWVKFRPNTKKYLKQEN